MKKFKKTAGIILSLLLISLTIIPCTVAYAQGGMAFSVGTDFSDYLPFYFSRRYLI